MSDSSPTDAPELSVDVGKLVLRASVAGMMLLHGVAKLQHGIAGITSLLQAKGWPTFIAPGVIVGEVLAPLLMIAGVLTRPAAIVFAFNMIVATLLVHAGDIGKLNTTGGWKVELQMLYFFGSVAIALIGAGRLSLSRGRGPWWR